MLQQGTALTERREVSSSLLPPSTAGGPEELAEVLASGSTAAPSA